MTTEDNDDGCPPGEGKCAHRWLLHEHLDVYGMNPLGFVKPPGPAPTSNLAAALTRRKLTVTDDDKAVLNDVDYWPVGIQRQVIGFIKAAEDANTKFSIIHCHGDNTAVKVIKVDIQSNPRELHLQANWALWISRLGSKRKGK